MKWKVKLLQRGKGYITKVYVRRYVNLRIRLSVAPVNSRCAREVIALTVVKHFFNQFSGIVMYEIKI